MIDPRVEIADLGMWHAATLLAEYDAEDDTIRISARAVEAVRAALGDDEVQRFIACAAAHERFHRAQPRGTEAQANAAAREASGAEPSAFEAIVLATLQNGVRFRA